MSISQNGYSGIKEYPNEFLEKWVIPVASGEYRHVILRRGHVGFLLAWLVTWYHENIEPINLGVWDEWGWAFRPVRGSVVLSNHASGTAVDVNATLHPLGVRNTFKYAWQYLEIRWVLLVRLAANIRWGGDYENRADEMHFEIIGDYRSCRRTANRLRKTKIGKRILEANKHYQDYVNKA